MMIVKQSEHIMLEPKLKTPVTSDMSDIVDAFRRNGLICKKPGAVAINGVLYVHPKVWDNMQRELSRRVQTDLENKFLNTMRW